MAVARIIDLPEDSSPAIDDYVPVDNSTPNSTRRTRVSDLLAAAGDFVFASAEEGALATTAQQAFATEAAATAATIVDAVTVIQLNGSVTEGDGLGGLYIDTNNGSTDTFVSSGGTSRTWYRAADVGDGRLVAGIGDIILNRSATGDFTSGGAYVLRSIVEREVNLLMFAPSLTNGANVSAAMQAMMTAAAATGKPARIPVHPLGFTWRMNTGVTVPGCKVMCDDGMNLETLNNINLFTFTSHAVHWTGGNFEHYGDGMVFDGGEWTAHHIVKPILVGHLTTATLPLILMLGSNFYLEEPLITTFRNSVHAIICRKTAALININSRIEKAYMGGTGLGILVDSLQIDNRVEGLAILNCKSILTGTVHIEIRSILEVTITGNMLDLGSGSVIYLNPTGLGIDGVDISNNWISAASNPTGVSGGVGIKSEVGSASIGGISIVNNRIRYCAYGIALTDNVSHVRIALNTITNIDQVAIGGPADDWLFDGNTYDQVASNLLITEGAGGGAISISNEFFDAAGAISLTIVTGSRWNIGNTSGKKLRRRTGASTAASPTTGVYVNIPHGLIAAPRRNQILLEASFSSGAYTNIVANIAAIDATNVTVQVWFTTITNGVIAVTLDSSI